MAGQTVITTNFRFGGSCPPLTAPTAKQPLRPSQLSQFLPVSHDVAGLACSLHRISNRILVLVIGRRLCARLCAPPNCHNFSPSLTMSKITVLSSYSTHRIPPPRALALVIKTPNPHSFPASCCRPRCRRLQALTSLPPSRHRALAPSSFWLRRCSAIHRAAARRKRALGASRPLIFRSSWPRRVADDSHEETGAQSCVPAAPLFLS